MFVVEVGQVSVGIFDILAQIVNFGETGWPVGSCHRQRQGTDGGGTTRGSGVSTPNTV